MCRDHGWRTHDLGRQLTATVKIAHTIVWAIFAACSSPSRARGLGHDRLATLLILWLLVEVLVLTANGGHCPLTAVAARYTDGPARQFRHLSSGMACAHNKLVFGSIYLFGIAVTFARWT